MKHSILLSFLLVFSLNGMAGNDKDDSWFVKRRPVRRPTPPPPDEPGVPLDGGLIGLIAAGGALGYKKYKDRNAG